MDNIIVFMIALLVAWCMHMGSEFGSPCGLGMGFTILGAMFSSILLFMSWDVKIFGVCLDVDWFVALGGVITYVAICIVIFVAKSIVEYFVDKKPHLNKKHESKGDL